MGSIETRQWVVQKYGGTSVGKLLDTITGTIIPDYLERFKVAVVCSARSGTQKTQGTTSLLLEAIHLATSSETSTVELDQVIDIIKQEHLEAAEVTVGGADQREGAQAVLGELLGSIENDCEHLRSFLKATWTIGEISERTQDRVLAVGETLACRLVVASLKVKDIDAEVVVLDDIVQKTYGSRQKELAAAFRRHPAKFLGGLAGAIRKKIDGCKERVPVVTGFFGAMPESLVSSVGRGYSDLCAALCAVAVGAEELQIWKEVDGIFTADPRKVKSARLLATVTSEEAAELTYYGSEVIHPLTIEQICNAQIPLRLKNVKHPERPGTIVFPSLGSPATSPKSTPGNSSPSQYRRTPTAVTAKDSITVFNIRSNGRARPQEFLGQIAQRLGRHDYTIDLISSSQQMLSLAVSSDGSSKSNGNIEETVAELSEIGIVTVARHMSIVSVVGHKMKNMVGISGEVFSALASARVNIYLISQGASEINISFVVKAQDALLAMEVVHTNVMRIPLHSEQENSFIRGPWLY
ncbi:aspartate kinase [Mytilinidion resinicola]|uniref:Aspartokinase n=1 Tax=Mytilinidion resinicola TaxID=574789 RepID=A0A6A6YN33_9PEZI|nr:aspartate kinase [Mytilinidion resinicola]KAF2809993.1 aspartate kinase [Mytilinidion resinicola]